MKKSIMELTTEQCKELSYMVSTGKVSACQLTHARMLLKADQVPDAPGWSDAQIKKSWTSAQELWDECARYDSMLVIVSGKVQACLTKLFVNSCVIYVAFLTDLLLLFISRAFPS